MYIVFYKGEIHSRSYLVVLIFFCFYFIGVILSLAVFWRRSIKKYFLVSEQETILVKRNYRKSKRYFDQLSHPLFFLTSIYLFLIISFFFRYGLSGGLSDLRFGVLDYVGGGYVSVIFAFSTNYLIYLILIQGLVLNKYLRISLLALIVIVSLALSGSRSLIGLPLGILFLAIYYTGKLSNRTLILSGIIGLFLMGLMRTLTIIYGNSSELNYHINEGRIIENNIAQSSLNLVGITISDIVYRTDKTISDIPEFFEHTYGKSLFFHFYSMLPGKQRSPHVKLNHQLFHGSSQDVGYPPTILSQSYMDFGYLGTIIFSLILGIIFNVIYMKYKLSPNPLNLFHLIVITYFIVLSCYGGFQLLNVIIYISFSGILNFAGRNIKFRKDLNLI